MCDVPCDRFIPKEGIYLSQSGFRSEQRSLVSISFFSANGSDRHLESGEWKHSSLIVIELVYLIPFVLEAICPLDFESLNSNGKCFGHVTPQVDLRGHKIKERMKLKRFNPESNDKVHCR